MHEFLQDNAAFESRPAEKKVTKARFYRPDTYSSAARITGLTTPHVYQVVHGVRETTPARTELLRKWAKENADAGRSQSPAVAAALKNLQPRMRP